MPNQFITTHTTNTVVLGNNQQALITETGSVYSSGMGVKATGSHNTVNVLGTVFADLEGILMGSSTGDSKNQIFIGETGYINGSANAYTIVINGHDSLVENQGKIWNKNQNAYGIELNGSTGTSTIINSGSLDITNDAIDIFGSEKVHVQNSGLIKAENAIVGNSGALNVLNTGKILGLVILSDAEDIFDTRSGTSIGKVSGNTGNDALFGSKGADNFDGGDDSDKLYGFAGNDTLDGGFGTDTISGGLGIDKLTGGAGNDILYGEAGNDTINGGDDTDQIYGGLGVDKMNGGLGNDVFWFKANETGKTTATADTIYDFLKGDKINLSAIDASTKHSGNDAFTFIKTAAFHGVAGELRYEKNATTGTWIYGDTNGDKKVDLVIHLDDAYTFASDHSDFVL